MKTIVTSIALLSGILILSQEQPKTDSAKTQNIESVTLTKKLIEKKSDRLVFDVSANPVAKGNTSFDLLKETPLVSSTDDKTLQIAGKGNTIIFINGRKTQMNPDALESFLKNTPAENIQKIEVITMPGSEFNVQSSDGVINIILKKRTSDGTNGNLRFANTQHKYNTQSASASLNFRKGKLGGNANINHNDRTNLQDYVLRNGKDLNTNNSDGFIMSNRKSIGGYLNLDYSISEKQSIGLGYDIWLGRTPNSSSYFFNTITREMPSNQVETLYNISKNTGNEKTQEHSINLNYELKLDDEGSKLNINTAYLRYDDDSYTNNITERATATGNTLGTLSSFNQNTPQKIDNFSSTVDFTKKWKNFTLGAGGNFNKTKTDNNTYMEYLQGNIFVKDDNQSNHFVYDEKISGLYLNIDKNFGEKISAKIGARMEFANNFGEILGTTTTIERNDTNFLPSFSFNYNINKQNNLSYSFTSRVRRPSFWELNPARSYTTEVNYIQNNPFVKASSVLSQELMYMYKSAYFLQISNSYTKDAIAQVPLQKTENGITTLRYMRTNYGNSNYFSANLGTNRSLFNQIWNINYILSLQINSYRGTVDTDPITGEVFEPFVFDYSLVTPFFRANNNIRLSAKKDWFLGINYFWMGKQRIDLGIMNPIHQLDLSVKKTWDNWTFVFDVRDVLRTMKFNIQDVQQSGNFNYVSQYSYSQRANLSITYNFGNQKVKKIRNVKGAASDIKNRTGN
ncbi:MAG: TonB-dependent receptor [Cruoricaptor ignavus]|nr:TonB-dependent receptor [Cruoricaptor ignavus]